MHQRIPTEAGQTTQSFDKPRAPEVDPKIKLTASHSTALFFFNEASETRFALFCNKTTEETDNLFGFLFVGLLDFRERHFKGPIKRTTGDFVTSKHPTSLDKSMSDKHSCQLWWKEFKSISCRHHKMVGVSLLSCRSISILSVLLQMSVCNVS